MDSRVYFSFAFTFLLACVLTLYKAVYACCSAPVIAMEPEMAVAGAELLFSNVGDSRELNWDFGDGSPVKKGVRVRHTYWEDGLMSVSANYNDECVAGIRVNVQSPKKTGPEIITPEVDFPRTVYVNETATFRDRTPDATHREWWVVEGSSDQTSNKVEFKTMFRKPGIYTVKLWIKGENMEGSRDLTVEVLSIKKTPSGSGAENRNQPGSSRSSSTLVKVIELDREEFVQVCMDYTSKDKTTKRNQQDRFRDMIRNHFAAGLSTPIKLEGLEGDEGKEVSNPDLQTLSKALYNYRVTGVELVPAGGISVKNGFRQYRSMIISIEKIQP